ncbi:hypothetical protein EMPS_02730 [Entomortierella parvispora]|uniref:C2H2-type domain-containing protein n=1 Tax=Entomortierella parvispora TaxID=205924 RepID=A0A9P3H5B4_9FUNG|nr:hypothetical protein EMPS_02730 [Entomortierella parvispora]
MNTQPSRSFPQRDPKYPFSQDVAFLTEESAQYSTAHQGLDNSSSFSPCDNTSQPSNEKCPFSTDPRYAIEPESHLSTTPHHTYPHQGYSSAPYNPALPHPQEAVLLSTPTYLPRFPTPGYYNPHEVGPSTQAPPVEHAHNRPRQTLQCVPLSPKHVNISFDNCLHLGLGITLSIDSAYLSHPALRSLGDCSFPKKQDSRKQVRIDLPSLPPSCPPAVYTFNLAPDTGLSLKVRMPSTATTNISHPDDPLGRQVCLKVTLPTMTTVPTSASFYSIKVESEQSKVRLAQQPSGASAPSSDFLSEKSPSVAKHFGPAIVDSQHALLKGTKVNASSALPMPSYPVTGHLEATSWSESHDSGNGKLLSPRMDSHSTFESFPLLEDAEQQQSVGEACAIRPPLLSSHSNPIPVLRTLVSQSALGKRPREEHIPNIRPRSHPPPLSPLVDESIYINYDLFDDDEGRTDGGTNDYRDSDADTEDETDDESLELDDQPFGQTTTHKNAFMWRKLGAKMIGCSHGWCPSFGDEDTFLVPCPKIYNRTSNCTTHFKREHQGDVLKFACLVKICKDQPKQSIEWKGRGKLLHTCEDMGCLKNCDSSCPGIFKSKEALVRHENKHSMAYWLKCLHSDICSLTFENSGLRSRHHSICFPGCPKRGNGCTHDTPKPRKSASKKGQK